MQKFLLLAILVSALGGCVASSRFQYGWRWRWLLGDLNQAASQAESGAMNPGETTGGGTGAAPTMMVPTPSGSISG